MAIGFIHLISEEASTGAGALYFCGIETAIAAINPARLSGFTADMLCPICLQRYEGQKAGAADAG